MKPISPDLPDTVIAWLELWRSLVLEPLRAADPPWTLERMAAELGRRIQTGRETNAARGDVSGTARTTLQKFFAGERVPTRDVVQHLLDIAYAVLPGPPTPQQVQALWAAYRAALRTTFALLADLYDAVDARDVALRRAQSLQEAHDRLTADLGLSRRQGERLQVLLRHSRTELEQAEQLAHSRDDEARRARADVERLTIQVRDLEAERDRMALDAQRLNSELQQLAEQGMARSTDGRVGELQAVQNALRAEHSELERLLATLTEALDAARGQAAAGPEADGTTLPALEEDRVTEVERRHTLAMHAIEHLSEQLRRVSRDFAHARAELVRRDGELARLVEQHTAEIAALRASSVLAEADNILSVALQSLGPTPALLPPDDNVPTPETTPSPSSGQPGTSSQPPVPPDQAPEESAADPSPTSPSAPPDSGAPSATARIAAASTPRTGGLDGSPDLGPPPRLLSGRRGWMILAAVVPVLFGLSAGLLVWALYPRTPGHSAGRGTTPSVTPSVTASRGTSGPPGPPAKDPVSDIGDQDVNTAAIMKLAVCRAQDVAPALRSVHNTYETQQQPHFVLTVKGDTGGRLPCRINVSRTSVPLTLTQAGADAPVWATSRCTAGHDEQRWLQVSRHTPATVDFRWDRRTNETSCTSTSHGPAGTYLVEERVLKQRMQTSFVLAEAAPETTPTPNQTDDKPTPTFSSTDGFIQGANGGGVNGGTSSSPTATGPAASSSGSDPGGNGGGSSNGGLFGGPTG